MRFRHQTTVPKQDLPVYAKDRLEKAEDENVKLREQIARLQRQRQDQEEFYEKRMAQQKVEWDKAQERKLAELQRSAMSRQYEEHIRSEQARGDEEAIAGLRKQIEDLQKRIERLRSQRTSELGKSSPEIKRQEINTQKKGESITDLLPPPPHPLHPISSLKEIEHWFFGD